MMAWERPVRGKPGYVYCPYNWQHIFPIERLQWHLLDCPDKSSVKHLFEECMFNAQHIVLKSDIDNHHKICPNKPLNQIEDETLMKMRQYVAHAIQSGEDSNTVKKQKVEREETLSTNRDLPESGHSFSNDPRRSKESCNIPTIQTGARTEDPPTRGSMPQSPFHGPSYGDSDYQDYPRSPDFPLRPHTRGEDPSRDTFTYPPRDTFAYPSGNTLDYPPRDISAYPSRNTLDYPPRDISAYPSRTTLDYPPRDISAYPPRDTLDYPPRDTISYPPRGTLAYYPPNTLDYPPRDVSAYARHNRHYFSDLREKGQFYHPSWREQYNQIPSSDMYYPWEVVQAPPHSYMSRRIQYVPHPHSYPPSSYYPPHFTPPSESQPLRTQTKGYNSRKNQTRKIKTAEVIELTDDSDTEPLPKLDPIVDLEEDEDELVILDTKDPGIREKEHDKENRQKKINNKKEKGDDLGTLNDSQILDLDQKESHKNEDKIQSQDSNKQNEENQKKNEENQKKNEVNQKKNEENQKKNEGNQIEKEK